MDALAVLPPPMREALIPYVSEILAGVVEFKRATVQRIVAGEKTVAELSRELDIAPSVIRNWKRFC